MLSPVGHDFSIKEEKSQLAKLSPRPPVGHSSNFYRNDVKSTLCRALQVDKGRKSTELHQVPEAQICILHSDNHKEGNLQTQKPAATHPTKRSHTQKCKTKLLILTGKSQFQLKLFNDLHSSQFEVQ